MHEKNQCFCKVIKIDYKIITKSILRKTKTKTQNQIKQRSIFGHGHGSKNVLFFSTLLSMLVVWKEKTQYKY